MQKVKITKYELSDYGTEVYKMIRTNLQFCGADKKTIVLTSCRQNEGKTHVALNLAVSLAELGKKVLLVDADLRKSVLVGKVNIREEVKGLSHFLSRQINLEDIVYATDIPYLYIIFAGHFPTNPAELLNSPFLGEMLEKLRECFDYILIDSPPLGVVIDSAVIATKCDGAIMVIAAGENSWKDELELKAQIEKAGCPILGVILNKVHIVHRRYGDYRGYGTYEKKV